MDEPGASNAKSLKSFATDTPWTAASTWLNMRLPLALAANGPAALNIKSSTEGSAAKEPRLEALCRPFGITVGHSVSGEKLVEMMVREDPLKLIDLLSIIAHKEWKWGQLPSTSIDDRIFKLDQFAKLLKSSDGQWLSQTEVTQRATSKVCDLRKICADNAAAVVYFLADDYSLEAAQDLIVECQQARADGGSHIKVQNDEKSEAEMILEAKMIRLSFRWDHDSVFLSSLISVMVARGIALHADIEKILDERAEFEELIISEHELPAGRMLPFELGHQLLDAATVDRVYAVGAIIESAPPAAAAVAVLLASEHARAATQSAMRDEIMTEKASGLFCWAACMQQCLRTDLLKLTNADNTAHYKSEEEIEIEFNRGWEEPNADGLRVPVAGEAYAEYHHRPWRPDQGWYLPGPRAQAKLRGMQFLERKNSERADWQRLLAEALPAANEVKAKAAEYIQNPNNDGIADFDVWMQKPPPDTAESATAMNELLDKGDLRVSFVRPSYEPLVCCSFAGKDRRLMANSLYQTELKDDGQGHKSAQGHSGADPWAICDFIRDFNGWPAHAIYIDTEVHEAYEKWKWSYTWAQRRSKAQLLFISEEWLKSEFCRGELIALQEVVKINPELEVIFVILASPRVAVDKKTISDKSFPVEWKEFLQPRDGSQDEQDFDVIAWANSQLQLLSEKKAAGGNTAAGKSTIAGRQTSREVRQYENERLENDGKCSKCKNIYKSHEITSWPNINGKNGKWHCRGCILTNIGNVKKSAKARDGWRPKLGHLELLAKRYGEEVQKIEQKCGGVYDMHYVWEWIKSGGLRKTDLREMSAAIIGLATDLQPLPDSWKGAQEDRGHQPAECPDECSQFRRRDDPLDMGERANVLGRKDTPKLPSGWAGLAWAPPIRSRNRYRDDTQRIDLNTADEAAICMKVPGLGKTFAHQIVHQRSLAGKFAAVNDALPKNKDGSIKKGLDCVLPFVTVREKRVEGREDQRFEPLGCPAASNSFNGQPLLNVIWQVDDDGRYKQGTEKGPFLSEELARAYIKANTA